MYDISNIPNSVDLDETIIETMGLYITRNHVALDIKRRIGDYPYLLEAEPIEAIDVNYPNEFYLAETIMQGLNQAETRRFNYLSKLMTSAMLSDILDDLGIDGFVRDLQLNLPSKKVLGRAKTLKLRALQDGEDFRGIYDALDSYITITSNDIIVVQNEVSEYAYFGGLNANLAIRSGALATIVSGKTRDSIEVSKLDYPVFSSGNCASDVRKRATVENINKVIWIQGKKVKPGDLIFGDCEGIIIIPREVESIVLDKALNILKNEHDIVTNIVSGLNTKDILSRNGDF